MPTGRGTAHELSTMRSCRAPSRATIRRCVAPEPSAARQRRRHVTSDAASNSRCCRRSCASTACRPSWSPCSGAAPGLRKNRELCRRAPSEPAWPGQGAAARRRRAHPKRAIVTSPHGRVDRSVPSPPGCAHVPPAVSSPRRRRPWKRCRPFRSRRLGHPECDEPEAVPPTHWRRAHIPSARRALCERTSRSPRAPGRCHRQGDNG